MKDDANIDCIAVNRKSAGKLRGLQQLANGNGIFTVCAIDHRQSLRRALNENNPEAVSYQDIVDFKLDLCQSLSGAASAILLDPVYGAGQAIAAGVLSGRTGLLVSLEKTGYTGDSSARLNELLADWSVQKTKRLGASAVKLLIYFRADLGDISSKQMSLVKLVAEQCAEQDISLLVESVTYPTVEEKARPEIFPGKKPELVIEAAGTLASLPIDVLKCEFPADIDYETDDAKLNTYCRRLSQASRIPWVLLSAGADFERFKKELEIACKNGASGFVAGRALWQEATRIGSREERRSFFENQTVPRLRELSTIADKWAAPWDEKSGCHKPRFAKLPEGWYKTYRA